MHPSRSSALILLSCLAQACSAGDDTAGDETGDDAGEARDAATSDAEGTSPDAMPPPAKVWSHFNWPPDHGGVDPTVTNELVRMIDATPPGATIRGNFFVLDLDVVADALNAAYDRGVTMRISLDGGPGNRAAAAAQSVDTHMGTSAGFCGGTDGTVESVGCITSSVGGIAHIKFMTFSETVAPDGVLYPNVTWFSSYNANLSSGDHDSNNSTSVYDAPLTYEAFTTHQIRMQNQRHYPDNDYYDRASGRGYVSDPSAGLEAHFSPEQDTNLVLAQLERITPDESCIIRIFQAAIGSSMVPTMNKLVELQDRVDGVRRGCQVFVVTTVFAEEGVAILEDAGIEIRRIGAVHDKIFLVDARFDGSADNRKLVFTGSHNWARKSSYGNDELLAMIESDEQYELFYAHFLDAWRDATAW